MATVPEFTISYYALASRNSPLGQEEQEYQNLKQASRLLHRSSVADLNPRYARVAQLSSDARLLPITGDFGSSIPIAKAGVELPDDFSVLAQNTFIASALSAMSRRHDPGAVRAYLKDLARDFSRFTAVRIWYDMEREDWRDILAIEADLRKTAAAAEGKPTYRAQQGFYENLRWAFALAHARLGDLAEAESLAARIPGDFDQGLRVRAIIADLQGQHARADWWFARSEKQTPSIPLTDLWWGQALVKRGQPDVAIEKFVRANKLGPKFADPLEGWGEALMAKNQSHLALAKFAEAEKYAPNWGRLHLKWGEAFAYSGKPAEAKAQLARAAALDLTPSEKSELARVPPHV